MPLSSVNAIRSLRLLRELLDRVNDDVLDTGVLVAFDALTLYVEDILPAARQTTLEFEDATSVPDDNSSISLNFTGFHGSAAEDARYGSDFDETLSVPSFSMSYAPIHQTSQIYRSGHHNTPWKQKFFSNHGVHRSVSMTTERSFGLIPGTVKRSPSTRSSKHFSENIFVVQLDNFSGASWTDDFGLTLGMGYRDKGQGQTSLRNGYETFIKVRAITNENDINYKHLNL